MPIDPTAESGRPPSGLDGEPGDARDEAVAGDVAAGEDREEEQPAPPEGPVDDGDGDLAFSPTLPPETVRFGEATPVEPCCEWCNASLPAADAARCPSCGALLQPLNGETEVPGLTTISSAARAAAERVERQRAQTASWAAPASAQLTRPPSHEAYQPPDEEVQAAMREIERQATEADALRNVDPGPLAERNQEEELG